MPYFTGLTITRGQARNTSRHGEQQQQYSIAYGLTGGVCEVARHPPHRSRSRRGAGRHAKLTAKRLPPYTSDSNQLHNHANRARKSWRSDVLIILPGWGRHTVGSRQHPQCTRADFGPEAVGSSNHRYITSPNVKPFRVKSSNFSLMLYFFVIFFATQKKSQREEVTKRRSHKEKKSQREVAKLKK